MKWFRFYAEALNDPKVQGLTPAAFKGWVNVLCIAAENDGALPNLETVAFQLRLPTRKAEAVLHELTEAYLLDGDGTGKLWPHNWNGRQFVSDDVTERVRKHRGNVSRNKAETPPDTEQKQKQNRGETETEAEAEQSATAAAFKSFEDCIGSLSAYMAKKLDEDVTEFGSTCVVHCLEEAAANGARNLKYAESIMRRHQSEGCYDNGREADDYPTEEEVRQRVTWLAETRRQAV